MPMLRARSRDQRHRKSGQSHQQQGGDQGRLAADAVAEMPENRGTYRARNEADGVDGESLEGPDPGIRMRKKQLGEDEARDGAVEKKVVPLDRGADGGRDDSATKLDLMFA